MIRQLEKTITAILGIVTLGLGTPAIAIENGESALGHPRIISTNPAGGSAFLYSDRIVFTQGHAVDGKPLIFFKVTAPGARTSLDVPYFKVVKAFVADGYREWNFKYDWARPNDFAILILDKPVPNTAKAKLASKAQIDQLKETGAEVSVGGYGFQSPEDRAIRDNSFASVEPKISSHEFANGDYLAPALKAQTAAWPGFQRPKTLPEYLQYHVFAPLGGPSTCDGDSGSGYFLEHDGEFTYLGTQGAHLGITNCGMDEPIGIVPLQGINPVYRYLDLVAKAEAWVASHPVKADPLQATLRFGSGNTLTGEHKTQMRKLMETNPAAQKIICTGIRYKTQSKLESIQVRTKAKSACEYAKKLNPTITTWYQTKTTSSSSYSGKVLLNIKNGGS